MTKEVAKVLASCNVKVAKAGFCDVQPLCNVKTTEEGFCKLRLAKSGFHMKRVACN